MVKVSRSIVPSFFTIGNMFCGFLSIIYAFESNYTLAAWLIFASAFLDTMDGKVARFTKSASQFGVEYDSLADVVSFGFAPSALMYELYFKSMGMIGVMVSFLPLLFGSIRLARFNAQLKGFDKSYFSGLPIPAAALTLASFVIFQIHYFGTPHAEPRIMLALIFVVSVLMVSTLRYETMPNLSLKGSMLDKLKIFCLLVGAIMLVIYPRQILFPLMSIYVLSGLFGWIIKLFKTNDTLQEKKIES